MFSRAFTGFAVACVAAGLFSGCGLLPQPPIRPTVEARPQPAEPFGDFVLTRYLGGGPSEEVRIFEDGAGVRLSSLGAEGGLVEAGTMDRLRALLGSPEFHDDFTRPMDQSETKVCDELKGFKVTFAMGNLSGDLPCFTSDRPTLDELEELLLQPDHDLSFPEPLSSGQPDLPKIIVEEVHDGEPLWRYRVRPDGTVVETQPDPGGEEPEEGALEQSQVDAIRLILRTELCVPDPQPTSGVALRVSIADREPVLIPNSPIAEDSRCLAYHAIAQIVTKYL